MATGSILANLTKADALGLDVPASSFGVTQQLANGAVFPALDLTNTTLIFSPPPFSSSLYSGNGWTITGRFAMASATANSVRIRWSVEKIAIGDPLGTDAFAAAVSGVATAVPGTAGNLFSMAVNLSNAQIDGVTGGDWFRLRLERFSATPSSDATGYLLFAGAQVTEQ